MADLSLPHPLLEELDGLLQCDGDEPVDLEAALESILDHFECAVGTIHQFDAASDTLQLKAQCGIPPELETRMSRIPLGKGMAGLAASRREPVQISNLPSEASGAVKPGKQETVVEGQIAVPILQDGVLLGVLGIAKPVAHEFAPAEIALLQDSVRLLGRHLVRS